MAIVRPCPSILDCPSDEPLDNFSSEADDTLDYISTKYYPHIPGFNRNWNATSCGDTFVSNISQADADMQALANAVNCQVCEGDLCNPNTRETFCNAPQSACSNCPGGTKSCFDVPGGIFCGFGTQAEANSFAFNFAYLQSIAGQVCLSAIPKCTCVGSDYNVNITANQPSIWTLDAGSLPDGLALIAPNGTVATIQGTPTTAGTFTFRIKARTSLGTYTTRTYSIVVLTVSTTSIPPYTVGIPYSFQLQASGGSGNYAWKIVSGSLPNGLSMSPTGLISGTPL